MVTSIELQHNRDPNQGEEDNDVNVIPAQELDDVLSALSVESDDNASMSDMDNESDHFTLVMVIQSLTQAVTLIMEMKLNLGSSLESGSYSTLLHTLRTYNIEDTAGGKYHHFGMSEGIKMMLEKYDCLNEYNELSLQLNMDVIIQKH
jgi:hypothetical protein